MSTDSQPIPGTQIGRDQAAQPAQPAPLPRDAVLVHVGMHKTGTTAIQTVLASLRGELASAGVVYPGPHEAHHREARSLTQGSAGWQVSPMPPPPPEVWRDFAADLREVSSRVVLSSEFFSIASREQIGRLGQDLSPRRAYVLIGVRNLGPVAVSTWQQTLKQGRFSTLDQWLKTNFKRSELTAKTPEFWTKFDPAAAIDRWSSVLGPERVTVVVLSDGDRDLLPTTFEHLLGLPVGRLSSHPVPRSNRGLTAVEAEVVRRVNKGLYGKLTWREYSSVLRNGAIRRMVEVRSPPPDEARPVLPAWVLDQVAAEGRRVAGQIISAGVHIVGDLADLGATPTTSADATRAPDLTMVPIDTVVEALVGAVAGSTHASWTLVGERPPQHARISDTGVGQLLGFAVKRLSWRARRLVRRTLS
jgi:hypothetical protein